MPQNEEWWNKHSKKATNFYVWVSIGPTNAPYKISLEISRVKARALVEPAFKKQPNLNLYIMGTDLFIG